ncbi:MAG: putative zinc-binding protein [Telluria sp.]
MSARDKTLPLVYSCSGCSSAAQMANHLAVQLDRRGVAEMSCIAGVGGNVASLVKVAQSGRAILALDGCPLECVKNSLAQRGVAPTSHVLLHELGVKKRYRTDFDPAEADALFDRVADAARALQGAGGAGAEPGQAGQREPATL